MISLKKTLSLGELFPVLSFLNLVRDQRLFESQAKNKDFENSRQSNLIQLSTYLEFIYMYHVRIKVIQKKVDLFMPTSVGRAL